MWSNQNEQIKFTNLKEILMNSIRWQGDYRRPWIETGQDL